MPKFIVTISVDAHVHYSSVVEAVLAKQFAREHESDLTWHNVGTTEYDERDWDNLEPDEVKHEFLSDVPALGPTPLHPACSTNPEPGTGSSSPDDHRPSCSLMAIFCKLDTFIEL